MEPKLRGFNDYTEREMPGIKEMAEGIEEKKPDWLLLNELFLRIVKH